VEAEKVEKFLGAESLGGDVKKVDMDACHSGRPGAWPASRQQHGVSWFQILLHQYTMVLSLLNVVRESCWP
jgi:hypothetical protein